MTVQDTVDQTDIQWQSYDSEGGIWFNGRFSTLDLSILEATDQPTAKRLQQILLAIQDLRNNDSFFRKSRLIQTHLEFPGDWGLGSSSTLLATLAQWATIDPYELLERTFGGSGYDLACAIQDRPLLYQRREGRGHSLSVPFVPTFREKLHFVYLNRKQNSREGIRRFREKVQPNSQDFDLISDLSLRMLTARDLPTFQSLLDAHEDFIAAQLDLPKVKDLYFSDFPGAVKSLGAWGGDFVLAAGTESPEFVRSYFLEKGMETVLGFEEMVLG
jgi:hypothetical protein